MNFGALLYTQHNTSKITHVVKSRVGVAAQAAMYTMLWAGSELFRKGRFSTQHRTETPPPVNTKINNMDQVEKISRHFIKMRP
jgi:hypothetical protein